MARAGRVRCGGQGGVSAAEGGKDEAQSSRILRRTGISLSLSR